MIVYIQVEIFGTYLDMCLKLKGEIHTRNKNLKVLSM